MEPLYSWGDELDMERVSDCFLKLDCRTGPWKEAWFGLRILKVLGGTGSFRASVRLVRKSKGGFRYLLRWEDEKTLEQLEAAAQEGAQGCQVPGNAPLSRRITRRPL